MLKIALAQLNFLVGDVEGNAKKIISAAIKARDEFDANIVVFTELSLTGYPLEDLLFRPRILNLIDQAIEDIKQQVEGIYILLGTPMKQVGQLHNAALLIYNAEIIACYHKHCLPNYDVFDEKRYFVAGENACVVEINNVQIGITICEDIWFPEPIEKSVAAGAELVINLNASPYRIAKNAERMQVLQQRISEQQVPIVYVNQVGGQDELVFDGESICLNKKAELCLQAPVFEQGIYCVEYSTSQQDLLQSTCMHAALHEHASVYQAIVLGVKDYVVKNNFKSVVLGLSGGIDSALTLAIAVDALGAENVYAIMMPFEYTSNISIEDARKMANLLAVTYDEVPIEDAFNAINSSLASIFSSLNAGLGSDVSADVTAQNIQSRIRGLFLMAVSNKTGRMLLTTGNKSEMSVGYATLYGDMAGGFAPLKDVSKTLVYDLARHRNEISAVIPERVITRPPSAELAPDQIDEDNLPAYEILDPILEKFVEQDLTVEQIVADGFDEQVVKRVANMVLRNEYKRRQTPPGVKITSRAFGKDRRYPITSGYKL